MRGAIQNVNPILEGNKAALKSFGEGYRSYPSSLSPELYVIDE